MRSTGIVRRIDDLGRIVIPKEIRRTMRLHEGAALEIYAGSDEQIILKKYSPVGELTDFAQKLCESMSGAVNACTAICDRDRIIAAAGACRKELIGQAVSSKLQDIMDRRVPFSAVAPVSDEVRRYVLLAAAPIITDGDVSGCVILVSTPERSKATDAECAITAAGAAFLGKETVE